MNTDGKFGVRQNVYVCDNPEVFLNLVGIARVLATQIMQA